MSIPRPILDDARRVCVPVLVGVLAACGGSDDDPSGNATISTLSTRADMVTGGDVLVEVKLPDGVDLSSVAVMGDERDLSSAFTPSGTENSLRGLVEGLRIGPNTLKILAGDRNIGELMVLNHPLEGPVFAGAHISPFICETQNFLLPDGRTLGPPTDANCSAPTNVQYVYRATDETFKPWPNAAERPADMKQTVTTEGKTVDYIVRLETGTINRAIYQIAILHDPRSQQAPSPALPAPTWNGTLIYTFGGGCSAGYHQSLTTGGTLSTNNSGDALLSLGYAVASSSLNVMGNSCNDVLSAESMMMVKEHFIENYGVPRHTIGNGTSGGGKSQYMIAESYPGLLDAIVPTGIGGDIDNITSNPIVTECSLLINYFNTRATLPWTIDQKRTVSGYESWGECERQPGQTGTPWHTQGLSPGYMRWYGESTGCNAAIPMAMRYDPATNPLGVKCDVSTYLKWYLGGRPDDPSIVSRPVDNVGQQYGLHAFNAGEISFEQFLELNEKVGGYDTAGQYSLERSVGSVDGVRRAFKTGRVVTGKLGLSSTPIIAIVSYQPDDVHDRFSNFAARERLLKANGDLSNYAMFTVKGPFNNAANRMAQLRATALMVEWLDAIAADDSGRSRREVIAATRPADARDTCWDPNDAPFFEDATLDPAAQCNSYYPIASNPRVAAGAPLTNLHLICQRKTPQAEDYAQPLTPTQLAQLQAVFPGGVCDYSKPSVAFSESVDTWLGFPEEGKYQRLNPGADRAVRDD